MPLYTVRKPSRKVTTMKAVADQGNRGLPPESELRPYEFGNGTRSKKSKDYAQTWSDELQAWV